MKTITTILIFAIALASCKSYEPKKVINNQKAEGLVKNDTVSISSDESDYEIIIIDPGFNNWLVSRARPRHFHSQQYLENRNIIWVTQWNIRARQPMVYDPNLYQLEIDYNVNTDYGYEVNYLLYNYFLYFQLTYNQRLSNAFLPRI